MSWNAQSNPGLFIPTTSVFELDQLRDVDVKSDSFKELLVRLYQNVNNIALALNKKDSGYYVEEEFVNGQVFPAPTGTSNSQEGIQAFRKVVKFGALPNTTTKTVAHGLTITDNFNFTRIYGAATKPTTKEYLPLPYASTTAANSIELWVDVTNINIKTALDYSAYTTTWIIIEYLKQSS